MTSVKRKYESPIPEVDEGWWESVLAEEGRFSASSPPRVTATKLQSGEEAKEEAGEQSVSVDWDQVKDLYMRDEVVELNVAGYNRGGLLV